ncbi:Uncharacterised protein [Budvicia aquatica]|uniref:Uncharacterized protein n=1 Tax=Budvicia aquatica TaxID=82979 RepID=A0A484ZUB2_9GAMM|nr:Uncharacterised protein [Budvicia aquatica]
MINLPLLSSPTLKQQLQGHKSCTMTLEQLEGLAPDARQKLCADCSGSVYQLLRC